MELFKQNDHDQKLARCLVLVELLVKLLHLADVTTNSENFGYVMPEKSIQIIDFTILEEMYYPINVYEYFLGESKNVSLNSRSYFYPLYFNLNADSVIKENLAKMIIQKELIDFKSMLYEAECFVKTYVSDEKNSALFFQDMNKEFDLLDLHKYSVNIEANFDTFCKKLNKNI